MQINIDLISSFHHKSQQQKNITTSIHHYRHHHQHVDFIFFAVRYFGYNQLKSFDIKKEEKLAQTKRYVSDMLGIFCSKGLASVIIY